MKKKVSTQSFVMQKLSAAAVTLPDPSTDAMTWTQTAARRTSMLVTDENKFSTCSPVLETMVQGTPFRTSGASEVSRVQLHARGYWVDS